MGTKQIRHTAVWLSYLRPTVQARVKGTTAYKKGKMLFVIVGLLAVFVVAIASGAAASRLDSPNGAISTSSSSVHNRTSSAPAAFDLRNLATANKHPSLFDVPRTLDAFLYFQPSTSTPAPCPAPTNGGSTTVGCRFIFDLMLDPGTNIVIGQQSYITFTYQLLQNAQVSSINTGCVLTNTVTADTSVLEAVLSNHVCNGLPCSSGSDQPGYMAYASGTFGSGSGPPPFRVARIGMCALASGQGQLNWQFLQPRNTLIIDDNSITVSNPALFANYNFTIEGPPTNTPTETPGGPTDTPTDTPTHTPTPQPGGGTDTPTVIVTSTECPIQFIDVPNGSTFYSYIRCLACRGIVNGYADGTFRPNNNVTRGQLSKVISNSAGFNDPQTVQMFQDVPPSGPGSTFFVYVGRLASRGYIQGYSCGGAGEPCVPPAMLPYFRPNNNATRGQIAKIDSNAAGFVEPPAGQGFQDVPPGSTFYTYTQHLTSRSIMQGYPCNSLPSEPCIPPDNRPYFRPFNNATRGQTSKIVANTFFPSCQTPARH